MNRIEAMENAAVRLPAGPAGSNTLNRIRMLKGLHSFNVANRAPRTQNQVYAELTRYEKELAQVRNRSEALRQLLSDNKTIVSTNVTAQTVEFDQRLTDVGKGLEKSIAEHTDYLGVLAAAVLEDKRNRINNDLAEAYLNIARLQDAALNRDNRPVGTTATPKP